MPGRKDDQVPGMVFEITAEELAAADALRRVSDYKRSWPAATASGKTAWVYVKAMNRSSSPAIRGPAC